MPFNKTDYAVPLDRSGIWTSSDSFPRTLGTYPARTVTDTLSRIEVISKAPNFEELAKLQLEDPELAEILKGKDKPSLKLTRYRVRRQRYTAIRQRQSHDPT